MTKKTKVSELKFSTSQAVEHTKQLYPANTPLGFQLDGARQVTDDELRTIPTSIANLAPDGQEKQSLVASNTVQGPTSITELARALNLGAAGNGPQLMYEWVYSNIEWEAGWGANKGAVGCLLDGMGNQFDQAMLLAALLRDRGYTANIVMGSIRLTEAQLIAWWKVSDIWAAQSYCGNQFIPIVTAPTWTGTEWYMDIKHVWVQWVNGATTYVFDPSIKQYTRKTGMSPSAIATALGYNATTFMTNAQSGATVTTDYAKNMNRTNIRSNLTTFTSNLVNYIKSNVIGTAAAGTANIDDLLGGQTINEPVLPLLQTSLPYQKPSDVPVIWTGDVPAAFKPTITIQFPNWSTPGVWDFTYQTTSDQLAGKRLTLWYDANRVPRLYLDGVVVATGLQQPVGTWTSIFLTVTHPAYDAVNYPISWQQWYQTNYQWWQSFIYTVGSYLIGSAWGNLGDGQMNLHQKRANANIANGSALTSEVVLGEKLAHAFYSWAAQNSKVCDLVNRLKNCHTTYSHQVGIVAFNNDAKNALTIDLGGVSGSSTNLDNDVTQTPINDTVLAMHGVALEAAIPAQETALTPGVSTTTVIDKAVQLGDRIYKGTSANWNVGTNVRNALVANGFNATDMDNLNTWYISGGNSILIHEFPSRTLGVWQGWGYWNYPAAGAYGIINGGIKGGSGQPGDPKVDEWGRRLNDRGEPISWDPIGMVNGDFSYQNKDLVIGSGEFPYSLAFVRNYSSAKQFTNGPLGRGWRHNHQITAGVASNGLLSLGAESAIQAAASLAQLFISVDLLSDTTRPVAKLVTATLADNWWIDQIVNNVVIVEFPDASFTFIKQPDGTYSSPLNSPSTLTLTGGLYTLKTPQQCAYNFNSSGNIATIVFPYGVTVTFTYTSGRLTGISNGLTRALTLTYTGNYLSSVSDGTGRSAAFSVNTTTQNLDSASDPNSKTTTFVYDNPGRLKQIKKPANPLVAVVDNVYDTLDRVKEQRDALNNLWQYYLAGSRAEEIDPQSNRKIQYFNRFGAVTRQIDQLGNVSRFEYDGLNRQTKCTAPEGNYIAQTYDLKGNVLTRTYVAKAGSGLANIVHTYAYHPTFSVVNSHTDGNNKTKTMTYDAVTGNLLTIVEPAVGSPAVNPTLTFTWNGRGQLLTKTDRTGIKTKYNYDTTTEKLNSVVHDEGTGKLNLTVSYGYNSRGDVTSVTDARGKITLSQFDILRRLTQTTAPSPLNYVTKFEYDDNGNRKKVEKETGDIANPWQTYISTYRADDLLASFSDPSTQVTTFDYTSLRQLWKVTDPASRVIERSYDATGRLATLKDPSTNVAETRTYTNNGRLKSLKDARNNTTNFEFDGHDRSKKMTFPNASYEQVNSYDGNGNPLVIRLRSGNTVTMTYDALNRLVTKTPQSMATVTTTYDLASRIIKRSKPVIAGNPATGDFESFFDTAGRFYKERYPDGKEVTHQLDANGNMIRTTWPDGYYIERVFDEINRLTNIKLNGAITSALAFDYDKLSRRKKLTHGNTVVTDYAHVLDNDMNSLIQTFSGSAVTFTYGFNNAHEVTSQSVSDGANYMWHPALGGTLTFGTANNMNQYPTVGGVAQSFNSDGCLTGDGVWTFTYDTENHLIGATKTGVTASYLYDPLNRQAQKTVGATKTRYIYAGLQRIADYDGTSGALQTRYVYGARMDEPLIKIAAAGTITYMHHDRNGNIIAITNNSGVVSSRYKYSPWGESPSMAGTSHGFQGQRFDDETGLYYMKARYYDSKTGRFLQPDPSGFSDGQNLYQFAYNNPNSFSDPFGLWGDWGPNAVGPGENGGYGYQWGNYQGNPGPAWGTGYGWGNNHVGYDGGATYIDQRDATIRDRATGEIIVRMPSADGHGAPALPGGSPGGLSAYGDGNSFGHSYGGNSPRQLAPGWGTPNPSSPVNWSGAGSPFPTPAGSNTVSPNVVNYYPDGSTMSQFSGGTRAIRFSDGGTYIKQGNGVEQTFRTDGSSEIRYPNGYTETTSVVRPRPAAAAPAPRPPSQIPTSRPNGDGSITM